MAFAADDRANDLVPARLRWSREREFLDTRLEQQFPPRNGLVVLGTEQRKSVYRAVPVALFGANRCNAKKDFFVCRDRDTGLALALNLVTAVVVRKHFNQARSLLGLCGQEQQ